MAGFEVFMNGQFSGVHRGAQLSYGLANTGLTTLFERLEEACLEYGQNELAKASGISSKHLTRVLRHKRTVPLEILTKLHRAILFLEEKNREQVEFISALKEECQRISLRRFAEDANVDSSNLSKILNGKRPMSNSVRAALSNALRLIRKGELCH